VELSVTGISMRGEDQSREPLVLPVQHCIIVIGILESREVLYCEVGAQKGIGPLVSNHSPSGGVVGKVEMHGLTPDEQPNAFQAGRVGDPHQALLISLLPDLEGSWCGLSSSVGDLYIENQVGILHMRSLIDPLEPFLADLVCPGWAAQ
jgi:hypothetical protein